MLNITKGKITIEVNQDDKNPNIFIKMNNVPILLIEQTNNQDKIVIKTYPNNDVYQDDNYLNLDMFDVNLCDVENIKQIFNMED